MAAPRRLTSLIEALRGGGVGAVLARGATAFLLIQTAGVAISFGVQVLLARTMGAEPFGTYVYVYSWMMLLLLLCRVGLGTASLRFVAAFSAQQDWSRLRGYLRTSQVVVLVASLVVATATALVVWGVAGSLSPATRQTFLVACLALPVYAFLQLWSHVLRGFKRILTSQLPMVLLQPAVLGVGALLVIRAQAGTLEARGAMLLNLASAFAALLVTGLALRSTIPPEARAARPVGEGREWLRIAVPLLLFNAMYVLQQRADLLMVGSLLGASEAGIYAPAVRVSNVIAFGLVAVNAWAAPLISDLHARDDRAGLQRLVRLAARGIFAFTLPVSLGVVIFGVPILAVFGEEFVQAYPSLVILVVSQVVNALAGPVGFLMTMTGRQGLAAKILAVHTVLLLLLNLVLIPRLGIEGAAIATGATRVSWNLVMVVAVWRVMRLRATIA